MGWYALDNIDEALQDSKDKLLPFDLVTWAKLAVIVFLTGQVTGGPSYINPGLGSGDFAGPDYDNGMQNDYSPDVEASSLEMSQIGNVEAPENLTGFDAAYAVLFAVGVALFGLLLLITYITSVFRFVMFKSMIDDVRIGHAKDFLGEGLQYLVFRWITLVATVLIIGLGAGLGVALGLSFNIYGVLAGLGIGAVVLTGVVAVGIIRWIAFNLALPEMVRNDSGLSHALEKSFSEVRDQLGEVAAFWLMKLIIGIGLGIATLTVIFPVFILLLIPFIFLVIGAAAVSSLLVVPVVFLGLLVGVVISLAVAVPIRVYVYSYILEVSDDLFQ